MMRFDRDRAMTALRLVLGLVVLEQSCAFVFSLRSGASVAGMHLPQLFFLVLGWSEIVAAILFLIPATVSVGAWLLAAIFVVAAAVHVLHGQYDVGWLIVYTAAVFAVWASRSPGKIETASG